MKKLVSLFAIVMFSVIAVFGFVGCDKSKNNQNGNSGNSGDSTLTAQQILKYAADDFDENAEKGTDCFASKVGEIYNHRQYDENVYLGMNLLREVSKISTLQDGVWYNSQETTLETGKANKVLAVRVLSETEGDVVGLGLIIKFSISGADISTHQKTYNLYNYDVVYNKKTKDVSVDAVYEKSRDIEDLIYGNYSKSNYFKFSYAGGMITTTSFERNIDIDDLTNKSLINNSSITEYNFFKFNLENNSVITEIDGFNQELVLQNSIIASVQEILVTSFETNAMLENIQTTDILVQELVFRATNAENISNLTN